MVTSPSLHWCLGNPDLNLQPLSTASNFGINYTPSFILLPCLQPIWWLTSLMASRNDGDNDHDVWRQMIDLDRQGMKCQGRSVLNH